MVGIASLAEIVRSPIVGGMFYPEDPAEVLAYMRKFGVTRGCGGKARAIVAPHGAWDISGALAGAAFRAASGRTGSDSPSRVVVMGPLHDRQQSGIFLSNSDSFETPLGKLPVDREISEEIEACDPLFETDDIPHLQEHSIEVLLPFVKYCFPYAAIVPILMGQMGSQGIAALARALKTAIEPVIDRTLLVVSFNMAMARTEAQALSLAEGCRNLFTRGKTAELSTALQNGQLVTCGGELVAALLNSGLADSTPPRPAAPALLRATGEESKIVYYGAFSFE